jgi:hypothetical protein
MVTPFSSLLAFAFTVEQAPFVGWLGLSLALVCLLFALQARRRQRLIADIPTIKTTGVFIGLVELKGTAEAERPLTSHLAETPCVYYSWTVEEHWSRTVVETYTDGKGNVRTRVRHESGWTTVATGGEQILFYLRDDCGVIRVDPDRAKVEPQGVFEVTCGVSDALYYGKGPAGAVAHSDFRRRFCEQAVPLHAPIYLVGQAREREDAVAPEVAYDESAPMFLISTRTEEQVSAGFAMQYWLLAILGLALGVGGWVLVDYLRLRYAVEQPPPGTEVYAIRVYLFAALGYLATWTFGWVWMAFNSLIGLRQRVRQAWGNVDVQLKRRSDLIPNLVRVVEGLRTHERELQVDLARLRSQVLATAPGQPGPDPEACVGGVRVLVEKYPELKTSGAFLDLQRQLEDTEQRIALARGYFNDIASFYDARLEVVPDRYLAALARLKPQPLITAEDFERAAVQVELA